MKQKNIYLVAHYGMKPREGVKTNVAGWMDNPDNLQYDEAVDISRGVKKSAATARILLNLSTKTVERNNFNSDRDFKSLFKYFFGGYHQYITTVMTQLDPAFLTDIVNELEQEMLAVQAGSALSTAA